MSSKLVDITVGITAENADAILVHDGDESEAVWLPRSQIEIERNKHDSSIAEVTLPEWLAKAKGLI